MTSYADQIETSPSLGAAMCASAATFVSSWEGQRSDVLRRSGGTLLSLGGCDLEKRRHFREFLGGPAECGPKGTQSGIASVGAAICTV